MSPHSLSYDGSCLLWSLSIVYIAAMLNSGKRDISVLSLCLGLGFKLVVQNNSSPDIALLKMIFRNLDSCILELVYFHKYL